jgi:hypothetical protein
MAEIGAPPKWRRSTRCGESGCVEVAFMGRDFLVRDSKIEDSPVLSFDRGSWTAFVAGVRAGEFD